MEDGEPVRRIPNLLLLIEFVPVLQAWESLPEGMHERSYDDMIEASEYAPPHK